MGACTSVKRQVTYTYKGDKKSLKMIPDSQSGLRKSIMSEIHIKDFEIFIDNQKIDSDESYKKFINSRTHLTVEIREKGSTKPQTPGDPDETLQKDQKTLKDSRKKVTFNEKFELGNEKRKKQHKVKQNNVELAPKSLKKYNCTACCDEFSVEIVTIVIEPGFLCISDESIVNPWIPMRYNFGVKTESGLLRYINTFEDFLLYKLEDFNGRAAPEKQIFEEANEFYSVIEGKQCKFTRDPEVPHKYSSNIPLESILTGQVLYSNDQIVGMVSRIFDPSTFIIQGFSSVLEIVENLNLINIEADIVENNKYHEEISEYSGKIYTNDGKFLMNWLVIHPEYIIVPINKLPRNSNNLLIKFNEKDSISLKKIERSEFSKFEYLSYFEVFQYSKPRVRTLPENFICQPKGKGVVNNDAKEISLKLINKHPESEQLYYYEVRQPIESDFQGSFISSNNKFFGIIAAINGYSVLALDLSHFKTIILTKKVGKLGKRVKSYPIIPANSISFKNPPKQESAFSSSKSSSSESSSSESSSSSKEDFSSEKIEIKPKRQEQEAGIEEENFEIGGEFQLDFNIPEAKPENYTYVATKKNLLKYNCEQFAPIIVDLPVKFQKGASFTTTPYGLVIVSESWAQAIKSEIENLPLLMSSHLFHACVWHKGLIFVVSGERNNSVETLEIGDNKWKMVEDLPESRKNSAICSAGDYVYLMGGEVNGKVSNSILRFKQSWENISFTLPSPLMKMGLIYTDRKFVIFGGSMEKIYNDMFYMLDENCKLSAKGEFPITGKFNNKPIGIMNDTYSILINEFEVLEFSSGFFKLVKMG